MDKIQKEQIINHCKILQLITRGIRLLHRIFRIRWHIFTNEEWRDEKKSREKLIQLFESVENKIKDRLGNEKLVSWDVTATCFAIKAVTEKIKLTGGSVDKKEEKAIKELREMRNDIFHGKTEFSNAEFNIKWNRITQILVNLKDNHAEIKEYKAMLMEMGKEAENNNTFMEKDIDEKHAVNLVNDQIIDDTQQSTAKSQKLEENHCKAKSELKKLNDEATKLMKGKKFNEAIEIYTKILQDFCLSQEDQAQIYVDRSVPYLLLKDDVHVKTSKRDAEYAIELWPSWWKGYFSLARAHRELENFFDAEKFLKIALALNTTSKEVRDELSTVKVKRTAIERNDNLNPAQHSLTLEENIKEISVRLGVTEEEAKNLHQLCAKHPQFKNVSQGHCFRDGIDVVQDFEKAAKFYKKAALEGNIEGMYNYGQALHNGQGIKCNHDEAMKWLLKAANSKPLHLPLGSGVPEAQHLIGMKYYSGIGVKKNHKTAAEWYKKASDNGLPGSANNLGLMYQNGEGVTKSLPQAFQYFKLASNGGDTAGMRNLAYCYFNNKGNAQFFPKKKDIEKGKRWLRIAADKGDMIAARELDEQQAMNIFDFLKEAVLKLSLTGMHDIKSLDKEQHGDEVKKAAQKGSIIAKRHMKIWENMENATTAFKRNDSAGVMVALSNAIRLDHQIVEIPEFFIPVIINRMETHSNEIETLTCFIRINSKNPEQHHMLLKCLEIFPDDEFFTEYYIGRMIVTRCFDQAIKCSTKALQVHPNSLRLMYVHALGYSMHPDNLSECIKALDTFIMAAPQDHDKLPACYYRKATYYATEGDIKQFVECFDAGLKAEKHQLCCFLPYQFPNKELWEKMYFSNLKESELTAKQASSNFRALAKIKLNVQRKLYHNQYRQRFKDMIAMSENNEFELISMTVKTPPNFPKPPRLVDLQKITIKDIDPTKDKTYDGFILEARIIEWPILLTGISTVIEDENGDVQRITIYNWNLTGKNRIEEMIKTHYLTKFFVQH